jgi:hypothetical protein
MPQVSGRRKSVPETLNATTIDALKMMAKEGGVAFGDKSLKKRLLRAGLATPDREGGDYLWITDRGFEELEGSKRVKRRASPLPDYECTSIRWNFTGKTDSTRTKYQYSCKKCGEVRLCPRA